jgi:hypothetical protein
MSEVEQSRLFPLHPYQTEVAKAIVDSVLNEKGLTFCVEIARQGGKNELSARIELRLLTLSVSGSHTLVKCSPTFKPQAIISMDRLKERLNDAGYERDWTSEKGYIIRLKYARALFLSADRSANVVGHTADLLLEVDEAQDVSIEKYTKEFKPMGATTNTTTVLYGTAWDDMTLLEETKQAAYELEKMDGIKRCFRYDWQEVAKYNPDYLTYVEGEKARLGEDHPIFLTQYRLMPVRAGGGFLSAQQRAQIQGEHSRRHIPEKGKIYIAGIDLAGEAEEGDEERLSAKNPRQDSTVLTIGELDFSRCNDFQKQPVVRIVEHYYWTGKKHSDLYVQLIDIIKNVWKCRRVVVDSTGVGQPVYSFLRKTLGSRIVSFTFTAGSKSELGYGLLAAVNSGSIKMYAGDSSDEYSRFWTEMEKARSRYRANQTMNFYVDPSQGHDDFLMSMALLVKAAEGYTPREAKGRSD